MINSTNRIRLALTISTVLGAFGISHTAAQEQISVGSAGQVWRVTASDDIYRRDGNSWTHIPGKLRQVAVGSDGTVWGVNSGTNIYRRDGNGWTYIPGWLKQISVGSAGQVWGVATNDNIYRRDGNSWTYIPGKLKHVSVSSDGTVWGVSSGDYIFRRDGNSWTYIPGRLKQISVGSAGQVWGVSSGDYIFRRDGNSWTLIPGRLKQIAVGSDGTVWGVNASDDIYRRDGNSWTQISRSTAQMDLKLPADTTPNMLDALGQGRFGEALTLALNSPGDSITIDLWAEASLGLSINATFGQRFEVQVRRLEQDPKGNKYELSLAQEQSGALGLEVFKDLEGNLSVGHEARLLLRYRTLSEIDDSLMMMLEAAGAEVFNASLPVLNELLSTAKDVSTAANKVLDAAHELWNDFRDDLDDARDALDEYLSWVPGWLQVQAVLNWLFGAIDDALDEVDTAFDDLTDARHDANDALQEVKRLQPFQGLRDEFMKHMHGISWKHYTGQELSAAVSAVPGVSLQNVGMGVSAGTELSVAITYEFDPCRLGIVAAAEVGIAGNAGLGVGVAGSAAGTVSIEAVFAMSGSSFVLEDLSSVFEADFSVEGRVGAGLTAVAGVGHTLSFVMNQAKVESMAQSGVRMLEQPTRQNIETWFDALQITLQGRRIGGGRAEFGGSILGTGFSAGGRAIWSDLGPEDLVTLSSIAAKFDDLFGGASGVVDTLREDLEGSGAVASVATGAAPALIGKQVLYVPRYDQMWRVYPNMGINSAPYRSFDPNMAAITSLGGMIYAVQYDRLYQIDPVSGNASLLGTDAWDGTEAMTAGVGSLFIVRSGTMYRVDAQSGARTALSPHWAGTVTMTFCLGNVYAVQADQLWRMDPATGNWTLLPSSYRLTEAMTTAYGMLYVVQNGVLYSVSPGTGDWNALSSAFGNTQGMTSANGVLYIIQNNALYAVQPDGSFEKKPGTWDAISGLTSV